MEILTIGIIVALLIGIYNAWMTAKIVKSVVWILKHVMIVGKRDPDLAHIKEMFGVVEPPDGPIDDIVDVVDQIDE